MSTRSLKRQVRSDFRSYEIPSLPVHSPGRVSVEALARAEDTASPVECRQMACQYADSCPGPDNCPVNRAS